MDQSSSDLEFFDFKNSSDDEIKKIQAILKGPGSNGCVELPWEIPVRNNSSEGLPQTEGEAETETQCLAKSSEQVIIDSGVNYTHVPTPQLPPAVETFVTLPATAVPYQNGPYFVSRTIPYLRAYPPMGMPFFACPLPPGTGEASPYGQFLPMNTAEPPEAGSEPATSKPDKRAEDPAVPLVPLPPSTFAGAGYLPGLHTLPYAGQPTSMYYVPVFNHPYPGGYHLPSPPVPVVSETTDDRVVETDSCEKPGGCSPPENVDRAVVSEVGSSGEAPTDCETSEEAISSFQQCDDPPAKTAELDSSSSSSKPLGEGSSPPSYLQEVPPEPAPLSLCLQETVASNDCHQEPVVCLASQVKVDEAPPKTVASKPVIHAKVIRDPSRCWADLFKGEVNGIDPHSKRSTLEKDITNGKVMPVNH